MAEADISPLAEVLGHAFYHFERIRPFLPTYGHLLVAALFPIWIGAHASLSRPSSAAKPQKKGDDETDTDDEESEDTGPIQKMEGLEPSDALMFPLTAGLTLGGLYLVIKWLEDPAILNKILSFYFSQMGLFFAVAFLKDFFLIVRSVIFPQYYRSWGRLYRVNQAKRVSKSDGSEDVRLSPLPGVFGSIPLPTAILNTLWALRNACYQRLRVRAKVRGALEGKMLVGLLDMLSVIISLVAVGYFAFVTKPWWLTNFLGFSFSYGALQFMSPSTFCTGSMILGSLFFYDIYFVFFTPLMVTVATKLDVPIKLLFPRPPTAGEEKSLAMLGLGDIVIPGMMIGLALRFDLFLYYKCKGAQIAQLTGLSEVVKPKYERATGSWGEKFWAPAIAPQSLELQPPYFDARSFPKVYFKASIVGYVIGMITTLLAMQYSNHAQPALLYLVPSVLISLWGTAFFRGEIRDMWEFSDAEEDDDEEKSDKEDTKNEETDKTENGQGIKGLFSRVWYGKPDGAKEDDVAKKTGPSSSIKSEGSKSSDSEKPKDTGSTDDYDLFSFSVSLHRKKRSSSASSAAKPDPENEPVMIPGPVEGSERPLKKRRGTPRKPSHD
ncbi:hypothetical protein N7468_000666 [Penicillium chermesinum]|uniref:Signal peptide peptidase n=1 Tax=Penicillium chermesinum TaxID=63820 RepID=A0A9W9TZK5_9EURO|nr:uncharacterized protein N7468_000666 [Penicillium chermesinum]KAJ5249215.1 hypothetical protein N7468_000666 [Penicillium chermesinum]KAJ6151310.1 hypothetical protein N7470_007904 [Penicillium chermesinum]